MPICCLRGIVFINTFQALRERDKIRAVIFFTLTALLATVAGLITHFDALGHAAGLPASYKGVSGVIPLWMMTAPRAVAIIGFLLTSRLKNFSFNEFRDDWQIASNTTIISEYNFSQNTHQFIRN